MATSASTNYASSRDEIVTRALRLINEIGTGQSPNATRLAECSIVLNQIFKEWNAYGMQLWKVSTISVTPVADQASYSIGVGESTNTTAPLKILTGFTRNTTSNTDRPLVMLTKQEYDQHGAKLTSGTPNQFYYSPPGPPETEQVGTLYVIQPPDSTWASNNTMRFTVHVSLEDFDSASDTPDVPSYYYNALSWALADQLAYESGVPLQERAMISQKAEYHRNIALSFDQEQGSLFIQPDWRMGSWN